MRSRWPVVVPSAFAWLLVIGWASACAQAGTPGPDASVPPSSPPSPGQTASLCDGLVTDTSPHPMSPLRRPAAGVAVVDPQFGTLIRRITDVSPSEGENAIIKPMYSTIQAWNADESRLILWHRGRGHELYDGRSYAFIRTLPLVSPSDIEHVLWDPVDPDLLYYPSNYNAVPNLMRYRVSTNANQVLKRFDFCPSGDWGKTLTLGSDPMYLSWDAGARVVGLRCGDVKFMYDIAADRVLGRTTVSASIAPQPAPSGQRVWFFDGNVYDAQFRRLRSLSLSNPSEHSSLGRSGTTGHDLFNSVIFDPPRGGSDSADVGTLVSFDMETGARKVVAGLANGYPYPPTGTHVCSLAVRQPGWVGVSVIGDPRGRGVLDSELLLANVDTGTVCRVGHHRSFAGEGGGRWGYWAEPHVVISPTATRLLFGSDWGNGSTVDTYVVELPAYAARRR